MQKQGCGRGGGGGGGGGGETGRQKKCLMSESKRKNCDRCKIRKFFGS